jgi:hypothetical protein
MKFTKPKWAARSIAFATKSPLNFTGKQTLTTGADIDRTKIAVPLVARVLMIFVSILKSAQRLFKPVSTKFACLKARSLPRVPRTIFFCHPRDSAPLN